MLKNKVTLICSLIVSGLAITSASAKAAIINSDGYYWDIGAKYTSFDRDKAELNSQPWFGYSTKATRFASRLGDALNISQIGPNGGDPEWGPFFAYNGPDTIPTASVQRYATAGLSQGQVVRATNVSPTTDFYYAIVVGGPYTQPPDQVPEPLNILGSLTVLGLGAALKHKLR